MNFQLSKEYDDQKRSENEYKIILNTVNRESEVLHCVEEHSS